MEADYLVLIERVSLDFPGSPRRKAIRKGSAKRINLEGKIQRIVSSNSDVKSNLPGTVGLKESTA